MHSKHVWRRGLNYPHYITLFSSKIVETDRARRKGTRSLFQGSVSWGRLSNLPKGPSRTLDIDCRKTKSLRTSYFSFSYWLVNCQSCNIGRPCQCYNFGSWQVSNWRKIEDERSPPVREFGFQNPRISLSWNPDPGLGIGNTAKDWNQETRFHKQTTWNPESTTWNPEPKGAFLWDYPDQDHLKGTHPRLSWIPLHQVGKGTILGCAYQFIITVRRWWRYYYPRVTTVLPFSMFPFVSKF